MEFFNEIVQETTQEYLEMVQDDCKEMFISALETELYDVYTPRVYDRTGALKNNVTTRIIDNALFVWVDINEGIYHSVVTGEDVSPHVADWVMVTGHNDNNSIQNLYHHYQARSVLETVQKNIENELGLSVQIITNENIGY